jgi:competence protein ComEA
MRLPSGIGGKDSSSSFKEKDMEKPFPRVLRFVSPLLTAPVLCAALLAGVVLPVTAAETPRPAVVKPVPLKAGVVNINTADVEALSELNGIGPAKAAAIIAHRKQHGPFKSVEQLTDVKGIGDALIDKNRGRIAIR